MPSKQGTMSVRITPLPAGEKFHVQLDWRPNETGVFTRHEMVRLAMALLRVADPQGIMAIARMQHQEIKRANDAADILFPLPVNSIDDEMARKHCDWTNRKYAEFINQWTVRACSWCANMMVERVPNDPRNDVPTRE